MDKDSPAYQRLLQLVRIECEPQYTTPTGIVRDKPNKQRGEERAVAKEVVRFAFDHAGITEGHLAPSGLHLQLMTEVGGYRLAAFAKDK